MRQLSYIVFFLSIILLIEGCKSGRQVTQKTSAVALDSVIADTTANVDTTTYYVTQLGDTLYNLEEEVAINLYPVRRDSITISAVGDIMMGTNFPSPSYLPSDSGYMLWREVRSDLLDADITFGNLEGTILTEGGEQKECNNPKACFLFRTPDHLAFHFQDKGFDLMSLANNHANDFGPTGRTNTQRVLDSLGIVHAGSVNVPYQILRRKGITIGFVAFAPNKGTFGLHDTEGAKRAIAHLDSLTDLVIVSFHGGAEGSKNQHIDRKREFYYGEDRGNVYEFARMCIDAGADLIIGHGPHVPRAMDIYKDRLIAYSLGNFLTYGRFNLKGANAYAPILKVSVDPDGKFLSGEIKSYIQSYEFGPLKDEKMRAARQMKALTETDFPETQISIDDSGRILYLQH